MRKSTLFLATVVATFVASFGARAQNAPIAGKHPRVAELENALSNDASALLRSRFPGMPFLLTVSIDPLRRYDSQPKAGKGEKLPYLDLADEEIMDEWDDPGTSPYALVARVKKVALQVSVPDTIADDDLADIKATLAARLNLNVARDEIAIQKRKWSREESSIPTLAWVAAGALALLTLAFFGALRSSAGRIASAVREAASSSKGGAPAPSFAAPSAEPGPGDRGGGGGIAGDVRFNDMLRIREVVGQTARSLEKKPGFPSLTDMLTLDRFGLDDPRGLGALLSEFSVEAQKLMFSYSVGRHWLSALHEPGELTPECLTTLDRLSRHAREESEVEWQKLLIYAWRLEDGLADFVKSLKNEESLALLAHMPKGVAVGAARLAFPGNWASVLDLDFRPPALPESKVREIALRALQRRPLRDFGALEQYRKEKDLLEYLRTANPVEEREIYGAAPPESLIHSMRPPFFAVFDLGGAELDALVPKIGIEDWSLALFNVLKGERREIEARFSEKQRFVYFERLKSYDMKTPSKERIGASREKVARVIQSMKSSAKAADASAAPSPAGGSANANAA